MHISLRGDFMKLGVLVKNYRETHDLTMEEFAKKSNLSKSYISLLEQNKRPKNNPSIETFQGLAHAMGLSTDELLAKVDNNQKIDISHNNFEQNNNQGTISNSIGSSNSHSKDSHDDSNNTYTTNNYYSSPCEHRVNHQIEATIHSKELFFTIIDYLRDMTDEQLKDTIKYIEFLLKG